MTAVRHAPVPRRRAQFCLDTGPLLDFLLVRFRDGRGPNQLWKKVRYLTQTASLAALDKIFRSAVVRTTTGVFVEIDRHVRDVPLDDGIMREFREYAQERFKTLGILEEGVALPELEPAALVQLGPVDASLIELARRHEEVELTILTMDEMLYTACLKRRVLCKHISQL